MTNTRTYVLCGAVSLLVCSIGLGACGTGDTGDAQAIPGPRVQAISLEAAPDYARAGQELGSKIGFVYTSLVDNVVKVLDDAGISVLVPSGCPQESAVDPANSRLYTCSVDFVNDTTWIESFQDANADGRPDNSTRVLIATLASAHGVSLLLHEASATLYVSDPLGDKVHRIADTDADGVPDTAGVFLAPGGSMGATPGVRQLWSVEQYAVELRTAEMGASDLHRRVRLEDTNEDGVADTQAEVSGPTHFGVVSPVAAGATSIEVMAPVATCTIRVVDSSGVPTETLATFTGDGGVQAITLSRAVNLDEDLELYRTDTAAVVDTRTVEPVSVFKLLGTDDSVLTLPAEGTSLKFEGDGFDGTVTVRCQVSTDATHTWHNCTVTAFTATTLTIAVPEMSLVESETVSFEFTRGSDTLTLIVSVIPD